MLQGFRYPIEDTPLFCRACQGMFLHTLRAQSQLRPGVPAPPKEPILLTCHHCRQSQVFVASEFRNYSPPHPEGSACKIAGRSRLQVKDRIYVPGQAFAGIVKSRFRMGNQETFVIALDSGEEYRYTAPAQQVYGEDALDFYHLLPFSVGTIRIGDPIFHPGRNAFGRAVGLLFGKETKLVAQLQDETLLLITLPESRQIPENRQLTATALEVLGNKCGEMLNGIHIEAGQGILYVRGTCSSLPTANRFKQALDSVPQIRGTVCNLSVELQVRIPDSLLCDQITDHLLSPTLPLFQVQVSCEHGQVTVDALSRQEHLAALLLPRLEEMEGLRSIHLDIRYRPQEEPGEREKAQIVAQALRRNATLKEARIRIFLVQGIIHLEGAVTSSLQKNAAGLAAMWAGRNFRVENMIRLVKNPPSSAPFIKVA